MKQPAQPARWMLALLLAPALASAQSPAPARIGYVDMKRLLDNAPQVVAGRRTLEREFAARDTALKADEQRLVELRRKQGTLGKDEADALQREIDALDRSIKRNRETMRNELKAREFLDQGCQEVDNKIRELNWKKKG